MKKIAKYLALGLCSVVITNSLWGCADKDATTENAKDFSKLLELTVWETQGTDYVSRPPIEDNIVEDWLIQKTNVRVDNIYGNDGGQWDPKLTKLVAGNNLPDIINCGSGQGAAHFAKLDQLGQVWHLTPELLQEYAPNVWNTIPQEYWDALSVDGNILGIPYNFYPNAIKEGKINMNFSEEDVEFISQYIQTPQNDIMFDNTKVFWIRDDILKMIYPEAKTYNEIVKILEEKQTPIGEELLDIPIYSTQEYIDFFYKIKDLNLKSNGKTVYTFGYNGGDNWVALTYLGADMYGYKGYNYASAWNNKTQSIEVPIVHDMVKEAAKTQNKMIRDGVIDPESLAHAESQYNEKILNGQYAIIPKGYLGLDINTELEKKGVEYRYRPFYTQVPAQEGYEAGESNYISWGEAMCILKTLDEDEMHQVLNWLNVQFSDEYQDIKCWGPKEAGLYVENEDGTRTYKDERFTKYYVENDSKALEPNETKGLGGPSKAGYDVGLFSVDPATYSPYTPRLMAKYVRLRPVETSGFSFPIDSPHVTSVKKIPPSKVWEPQYSTLQSVIDFWGAREQWEAKFKLSFAADSDEMFEEKWQEAIDVLNEITDIEQMEKEMTEIARGLNK